MLIARGVSGLVIVIENRKLRPPVISTLWRDLDLFALGG